MLQQYKTFPLQLKLLQDVLSGIACGSIIVSLLICLWNQDIRADQAQLVLYDMCQVSCQTCQISNLCLKPWHIKSGSNINILGFLKIIFNSCLLTFQLICSCYYAILHIHIIVILFVQEFRKTPEFFQLLEIIIL